MIGTRLVERYELTGELGRGGMGMVYRAWDGVLQREVAVKMIPPAYFDQQTEERFQREARVVAQMDHPAIVSIHDLGRHQGSLFFVMPWVQGKSLQELIRDGTLVLDETLEIAIQVAEALDYSHSREVVHRDVKPANIMVTPESRGLRVRVMDFGLAREMTEPRLSRTGSLTGTLAYASPEQVSRATLDGRSDLYSLGTVLYECLAGEPPFSGGAHSILYRIAHEHPQELRSRGVEVDEALEEIVHRCLAKEPSARPQRGKDLATDLRCYRGKLGEGERSQPVARTAPQRSGLKSPPPPMVGRKAELVELGRRLNATLVGECWFVLVGGEAGTGKSRLVLELEQLARAREIRVLKSRFTDRESAFPYQGLCELIQDFFRDRNAVSSSAEIPDISDLVPDLLALFPVLSEVEGFRLSAAQARPAAEARDRSKATYVFELLARTLTRLAGGKPLVLVLDNLHAGILSVEGLEYLVYRLGPTPTLIVGTYRPTEIDRRHPLRRMLESFHGNPRFCSLMLGPLEGDDFRELVELLVGGSELRDELLQELYEATGGNPLFAQELIRSLLETGGIDREASGWWALSEEVGIPAQALPATIQQAVEKRIERLPSAHRRILSMASVLGKRFEYRDLEELLDETSELEEAVDELVRQEILEEDRKSRGDRLSFAGRVLRDLLYGELSRRKRRSLHRRHAYQLEARYAGRLERVYPQLVHHFSAGDVGDKTVEYARALARRSLDAWSPENAIRAVRTALEFVDDEDESPPAALGELLQILAEAHRALGNTASAFREAGRASGAFEKAQAPRAAAGAALVAAETAWQGRQVDETRRWVGRGIDLARRCESRDTLRRLLALGATVANLRAEYQEAKGYLEEAERLSRSESEQAGEEPVPVGGILAAALPNPVPSLDPGQAQTIEEMEVTASVFETLLASDPEGNPVSSLCKEWEGSHDGRRFVLTLKADVRFSDGHPLTAGEVKASLERSARLRKDYPLAIFSALEGFEEFLAGRAGEIRGLEVTGGDGAAANRIVFHLVEPLPIFPTLLADPRTAVARPAASGRLLGTGPFRAVAHDQARIVLERNSGYWRGSPPPLERVEFHTSLDASGIAAGLRAGEIDLGTDLLPEELEEMLRDPRFREGLTEITKRNVYFVLFNLSGPVARKAQLRRALAGVVRTQDLVWRTLGRFAQPAVCLIPPGILGHDPGRRHQTLTREEALEQLEAAGLSPPIRLRAAIHPLLQDHYGSLTKALLAEWSALGVEVSIRTPTIDRFVASCVDNSELDLWIGRWHAVYNDPDNFTYGLFHTRSGILRTYFSSPAADRLLERARQESRSAARQALYRRFEALLVEQCALLPLFHDIDYRIAGPEVRGLRLQSTPPYVNYSQLGKAEEPPAAARRRLAEGGEIHVPTSARIENLDPKAGYFAEEHEVTAVVFETLTQVDEAARIVPHLAAAFELKQGGRSYGFQLRPNVRFHDGRRLTTRDVRYSFERVLRTPKDEPVYTLLLPIRGAEALREGSAPELSGFRILSATEFVVELDRPMSFFPALLSNPGVAIVPEGAQELVGRWRDGCAGTGPFRVVHFAPGQRLELEKNPHYWRPGYPKSDRLVFHFGISPERILAEFRSGRFSLAAELRPADVEALRREPELMGTFRESPRLSTYLLALNVKRGPFADPRLRRAFADALAVDKPLRETLGRLVIRAHGVIPPGLVGYEVRRRSPPPEPGGQELLRGLRLRAIVHPAFVAQYAPFWEELGSSFRDIGVTVDARHPTRAELPEMIREGAVDLAALRRIALYPDVHGVVGGLLHSEEGLLAGLCRSQEIDRLIEQGRSEPDPALRHPIYRRIEETIARETLLIPLFHEQIYRFAQPGVKGLRIRLNVPEVRYEELAASD
ncbi:MAG: protein kinase [bacterium]|nr:protein kinase [bacterium]